MLEKSQKWVPNILEKSQKQVLNVLERSHMIDRNIDKMALTNLLTNKEYGIAEALVLNNENTNQKGNVLYAPIYMTMFVEKKRVLSETKYVLDMEGVEMRLNGYWVKVHQTILLNIWS